MYEANNLVDAIYVRDNIEATIDKVLEKIESLEVKGVFGGGEYQFLIIELGELEAQLAVSNMVKEKDE